MREGEDKDTQSGLNGLSIGSGCNVDDVGAVLSRNLLKIK